MHIFHKAATWCLRSPGVTPTVCILTSLFFACALVCVLTSVYSLDQTPYEQNAHQGREWAPLSLYNRVADTQSYIQDHKKQLSKKILKTGVERPHCAWTG